MSSPSNTNPVTESVASPANLSYTALIATLVLLLAVSSAIVVRSVILRRRHQRLVEEAMLTGTWVPNRFDPRSGRKRRDIGKKPKLWEAWLQSSDDDGDGADGAKGKWNIIMASFHSLIGIHIDVLIPLQSPFAPHTLTGCRQRRYRVRDCRQSPRRA